MIKINYFRKKKSTFCLWAQKVVMINDKMYTSEPVKKNNVYPNHKKQHKKIWTAKNKT